MKKIRKNQQKIVMNLVFWILNAKKLLLCALSCLFFNLEWVFCKKNEIKWLIKNKKQKQKPYLWIKFSLKICTEWHLNPLSSMKDRWKWCLLAWGVGGLALHKNFKCFLNELKLKKTFQPLIPVQPSLLHRLASFWGVLTEFFKKLKKTRPIWLGKLTL